MALLAADDRYPIEGKACNGTCNLEYILLGLVIVLLWRRFGDKGSVAESGFHLGNMVVFFFVACEKVLEVGWLSVCKYGPATQCVVNTYIQITSLPFLLSVSSQTHAAHTAAQ